MLASPLDDDVYIETVQVSRRGDEECDRSAGDRGILTAIVHCKMGGHRLPIRLQNRDLNFDNWLPQVEKGQRNEVKELRPRKAKTLRNTTTGCQESGFTFFTQDKYCSRTYRGHNTRRAH